MSLSTMNWKRGLLRLWAVVAVLWVSLQLGGRVIGDGIDKCCDSFDLSVAFIPPLLLLALGYIGLWVRRGFRR